MYRQTVLFASAHGTSGLWVTNGTSVGTYELTGISGAASVGISPSDFTVFNGQVLFSGINDDVSSGFRNGLWVTDGTAAGTHELSGTSFYSPFDLTILNDEVLFHANFSDPSLFGGSVVYSTGLAVTDGTASGTHEITGINGAVTGPDPQDMTNFNPSGLVGNDLVLFNGVHTTGDIINETTGTRGLWVTDGTGAGTHEITGISGANSISGLSPFDLTVFSPSLGSEVMLFDGLDASGHNGLWVTDGTGAGTHELAAVGPLFMTVLHNFRTPQVLFSGTNASGYTGLWLTNGTAARTHEITGISGTDPSGLLPRDLTAFNGEIIFGGRNASGLDGLWVTDGTAAGTHEITGISGANPRFGIFANQDPGFVVFSGQVLFDGSDTSGFDGLWVTDGTAAGTHEIHTGLDPDHLTSVSLLVPPPDNFNSNNTSDILFRNNSTGDTWFAAMSNGALIDWTQIGGSDTRYNVAGAGDFMDNGTSDILFRNGSSGDMWFEAMSNGTQLLDPTTHSPWHQIGGSDTHYSVVGVGDFDANGSSDILFRNNSTGDTWYAAMSSGAFTAWLQIGGSNTSYSVVGVGDFGSGNSDILFRNNSTGNMWAEVLNNGSFAAWHQIGGSDTHYSVVGIGDFYGNGTDDILFRNNSTGDIWFAAMSNGNFASWQQIGGSDTHYAAVAIGDYYGNNTSDILFRNNANGDTWFAAMNNGALAGWQQVAVSDPSYRVPVTIGPSSFP